MAAGFLEQDAMMTVGYARGRVAPAFRFMLVALGAGGLAAALGACAQRGQATITSLSADLSCADDSRRCIQARARALRTLRADTSRAWLATPPSAAQYAAGVRMFALRKDRSALTCAQLKRGHAEAVRSPTVLRSEQSRAALTPAQISRGVMLADDVRRDLEREQRKKRCNT